LSVSGLSGVVSFPRWSSPDLEKNGFQFGVDEEFGIDVEVFEISGFAAGQKTDGFEIFQFGADVFIILSSDPFQFPEVKRFLRVQKEGVQQHLTLYCSTIITPTSKHINSTFAGAKML
jgi:hypothetical protein